MNHSFNIELASEVGIEGAILIENLYYWIKKNIANKTHSYDGKNWTYNSTRAFQDLFPYMNKNKISRELTLLKQLGYIETGNFNKISYDRTLWYSLTEKSLSYFEKSILEKWEMEDPKMQNGDCKSEKSILENSKMENRKIENRNHKSETPIPNINTDINTDVKTNINTDTNNAKALLFMQKFNEIVVCNLGLTDNNKKEINKLLKQFSQSSIEITEDNIIKYITNFKNMIEDWGEGFEKQFKNLPLLSRHFNQIIDYEPKNKKGETNNYKSGYK